MTLTAAADASSVFTGWSGDCSGTSSACSVTMSAARNVTANFTRTTLTATKAGAGVGTVTSNPAGINCGTDCPEDYTTASSTTVMLTAAADASSVFAGWFGSGCTGTAPCTVTMTAAKSVTATFTPKITPCLLPRVGVAPAS